MWGVGLGDKGRGIGLRGRILGSGVMVAGDLRISLWSLGGRGIAVE